MNPRQYFSNEYLQQCKQLTPDQVVRYLDDFRLINKSTKRPDTKLISIKIETDLLNAFKVQAHLDGVPYQKRIKTIMKEWLVRKGSRSAD